MGRTSTESIIRAKTLKTAFSPAVLKSLLNGLLALLFCSSHCTWAQEVLLTNNAFDDRYASYSPDDETIVFESNRDGNWEIYLMDSDGTNQTRLTNHDAEDRRPSWHPTGEKIIFESNRGGASRLYEFDFRTRKVNKISIPKQGKPMFASYSPDGKTIAFSMKLSDDVSNLVLLNLGTKINPWTKIVSNGYRNFYPKWSPTGKEIVFFSRKDTENQIDEIYIYGIETKQIQRMTQVDRHSFCPSFSRSSKRIAFVNAMPKGRPQLFIMNRNGKDKQQITYHENGATLPNWAVKDKKLVYTAFRNGSFQICEMALSE